MTLEYKTIGHFFDGYKLIAEQVAEIAFPEENVTRLVVVDWKDPDNAAAYKQAIAHELMFMYIRGQEPNQCSHGKYDFEPEVCEGCYYEGARQAEYDAEIAQAERFNS